jgi:hypothetical protein
MAKNFHTNFLEQLQGQEDHTPPKTMAIVDTQLYTVFIAAWDALSAEFNLRLADDADFVTFLRRARSSSLAFMGPFDGEESRSSSALDIGSFLSTFKTFCAPDPDSDLWFLLEVAEDTYSNMFIRQGVGEGTPPATGVHINWPTRRVYQDILERYPYYSYHLFDSTYATASAPNWLEFLENYYVSVLPSDTTDGSVCTLGTSTSEEPESEGDLLMNPSVEITSGGVEISAEITRGTDEVLVEYGTDMTPNLEEEERRLKRRILETVGSKKPLTIPSESMSHYHPMKARSQRKASQRMDDSEDYFFVFGGDVLGDYEGSRYTAIWDRNFYILVVDDVFEAIYASDFGGGFKDIPVFYFSEANPITPEDIPFLTTIAEAEKLGGQFSVLSFTSDRSKSKVRNYALYTYGGEMPSETPRSAGGYIVPIVFTRAVIGDVLITELVGGFNSTVFAWNEESTFSVVTVGALEWLEGLELDTVIMDVSAYDYDTFDSKTLAGFDLESFYLSSDELASSAAAAFNSLSMMTCLLLVAFGWYL